MKVSKHRSVILVLASVFITFFGCKKDDNESPSTFSIVGSWELAAVATDANGDGQISSDERMQIPAEAVLELMFQEDGTGVERGNDDGEDYADPFTWSLSQNNTRLLLHYEGESDPDSVILWPISATEIGLEDDEDQEAIIYIMQKK